MSGCSRSTFPLALLVAVLLPAGGAAQAPPPHGAHAWDYGTEHGPAHWGELKPEFAVCKTGHHQSPIDIQRSEKADLPALEFRYRPSPLRIVDNGHTIMATYAPGSVLRVGGQEYELKQFHFHRPSENRIHGRGYEMEAHLVHADKEGRLAVVAVMLEKGQENPLVRELWKDVPAEKEKEAVREDVRIDASQLLPADRGYYAFEGSLTTPPCSENVAWMVLRQPLPVSAEEIEQFARLYRDDARPAQPLYGRVVKETR
jgi:carbonic anhydrase